MVIYIQNGNLSGIESEIKRLVKKDREYRLEMHETKTSINKRRKLKNKNDPKNQ